MPYSKNYQRKHRQIYLRKREALVHGGTTHGLGSGTVSPLLKAWLRTLVSIVQRLMIQVGLTKKDDSEELRGVAVILIECVSKGLFPYVPLVIGGVRVTLNGYVPTKELQFLLMWLTAKRVISAPKLSITGVLKFQVCALRYRAVLRKLTLRQVLYMQEGGSQRPGLEWTDLQKLPDYLSIYTQTENN